jgi:hypothetical protein
MLLSMHPASCCEFENKSSVELFLALVISQLQKCLGISFLLAAKELIQCHGFPEHVIIKVLDGSVYSRMFPQAVEGSAVSVRGASAADAVVDVSALANETSNCSVCLDPEISLIRLPCGHVVCDECFAHYFLSDPGQHAFGTLPEQQTPLAVCVDEDGDASHVRDFFSCPICKLSLSDEFWEEFPLHLEEVQSRLPDKSRITLDHVHGRIVANALRLLREDPHSSIARCEQSKLMKGRYIVALNTTQAVTCMARTFDCVQDFRSSDDEAQLPYCGLSPQQLSQWKNTINEANAELQKSEAPLLNVAGVEMKRSAQTGLLYCNRLLGKALIPGSDGRCGPNNGPQCEDCKSQASTQPVQPTFVSDTQRKTSPEAMLKDIRMCPRCFGGYFINTNCSSLGSHHGEMKDGMHVQNVCKDCGFYSERWSDWPVADERLKAQKIKAHLPFLKSVKKAVGTIQHLLSRDLATETVVDASRASSSSQLLVKLSRDCIGRHFLRNRLTSLLRIVITAALETVNRAVSCSLIELSAAGKHAVLVLQLLQATDSFAKQYLGSATLLGDNPHSDTYALSAMLLSFAAVENWTEATLDNFISGNLGTTSTAPPHIKSLLDSAADRIIVPQTLLHSKQSMSDALAQYRFSFDGVASHELHVLQRVVRQLDASMLFRALQEKFGFVASHAARELLHHVSFKKLFQLLAAAELVSSASALLPLILPSHFSFLHLRAAAKSSMLLAVEADVPDVAAAVVADILKVHPLANSQLRAARFNQSRSVQSILLEFAAAHVSVSASGCMHVCGPNSKAICVLDSNGDARFDLYITQNGEHVPVHNLRATAHDPSSGNIFVSDSGAGAIYCIDSHGQLLFSSPVGAVTKPAGLSFCSSLRRIAVADGTSVRILRADDLTLIKTLARINRCGGGTSLSLTDDLDFKSCCDVAFDACGYVYAVDSALGRVAVFDGSYVHVTSFGSCGSGVGQFTAAQGVCIDGTGKVFVSDSSRLQMFDRQGRHVVSVSPQSLDQSLQWSHLGGVGIDNTGRLLVCSHGTKTLLRIL